MGLAEYMDGRALTPPVILTASHYISCKNEVCVVTGLLWRAARGGVQSAMWTQTSQSPARERRGRGKGLGSLIASDQGPTRIESFK